MRACVFRPRRRGRRHGVAGLIVAAETAGAMPDRMLPAEVAPHEDLQASTGATAGLLGDLQRHVRAVLMR